MILKKDCNKLKSKNQGMTLVELMIAIVIIGILGSIAYPLYSQHVKEGHRKSAMADMAKIQLYLEEHYSNQSYTLAANAINLDCKVCTTDTERYTFKVSAAAKSYEIIATPLANKGQDSDECKGNTTYAELNLNHNGVAKPKACW